MALRPHWGCANCLSQVDAPWYQSHVLAPQVRRTVAMAVMQVDGRASAQALVNRAGAPSAMLLGLSTSVLAFVRRAVVTDPFPVGFPTFALLRTRTAIWTRISNIKHKTGTVFPRWVEQPGQGSSVRTAPETPSLAAIQIYICNNARHRVPAENLWLPSTARSN